MAEPKEIPAGSNLNDMLEIGKYSILKITSADQFHINRICGDVNYWALTYQNTDELFMPPELLIGYANVLLRYWTRPYMHRNKIKCMCNLERALRQISHKVFSENWEDMETRAVIMRLFHEAGYGVQYVQTYRL